MKLAYSIAIRFLKSSKAQTILILLGIAVGVSVQIFIGSLIQGLQIGLVDKTIGNSSQITVSSKTEDKLIDNWEEKVDKIKEVSGVENVAVSADFNAFLNDGSDDYALLIRGFNIEDSDKIYNIKDRIYEGTYPKGENEIILGKEFQKESEVKLGEDVYIVTAKGNKREVKIVGFYDFKVSSINKNWAITTLKTSQDLFSFGNKTSFIEMQVKDPFIADELSDTIKSSLNSEDVKVENWKEQNEQLLSGLKGQNISSIMIQIFVLISVLLGIASILAITVVQKSKQIGILKAMGIQDKTASQIFLFEGIILGIFGALLGIALGLGLLFMFTKFAVNSDGTPVVDIYINYKFIGFSGIVAILSATIASAIPAINSSKLSPIEVIKNA
ncbi:ABC transporter permease [Clostridium algidicarnis]|uniref:Lipoprotein-releasing system permease protein n=2 Tax=Clostridium algidicarnis TaxID=37659 RepID=A0A2S6FZN2_9CLOT|nr:FtsX-like permease family protein [Clostridium algidicarnis]MBU3204155.1 FtsX-like permease family protein [Clostridium algidicarnis]MBU3212309.1 FtsX-like permease family protein [Clostridium algidicarnis]MBU3220796.1 FtsX-like permease family protein [Clostridium algidicarnis]MBU3221186.1 FtsX-like permease family protein [Clostridium algidicarnis]PPK49100.1 lipoprotein-releasing system permease protein [Clostridium algidicarnis DSM 15099]